MKMLHIVLLGSLASPMPAAARETGRDLSDVHFADIDTSGIGLLDLGEVSAMAESIAYSADGDENDKISLDAFMALDFGYAYLADQEGAAEPYAAVKRVILAVPDLDGDMELDAREMRLGTRWSFERAGFDGNAMLTESEFLNGWTPIVMLKAGRGT